MGVPMREEGVKYGYWNESGKRESVGVPIDRVEVPKASVVQLNDFRRLRWKNERR